MILDVVADPLYSYLILMIIVGIAVCCWQCLRLACTTNNAEVCTILSENVIQAPVHPLHTPPGMAAVMSITAL